MPRSHRAPRVAILSILFAPLFLSLVLAQGVRETVQVGLVSIRLDVRGKDGRPVSDLKRSEVKVRVDGREVPIEGLDRTEAAPAAAPPPAAPPAAAPSAAHSAASSVASPAASSSASSELWVAILVDETASNPFDRREIYRQVESFLGKGGGGTHVMLERFDGRLRVECPWTTDRSVALAAAKKMSKRMTDSRIPSPSELRAEIQRGSTARDVQLQIDQYARRSFDGMVQALLRFPEVTGKRALVAITDGTPLISPFDLSMMLSDVNATTRGQRDDRAAFLRNHEEEAAASQIEKMLLDESLKTFQGTADENSAWVRRMAQVTNKALELDIAFYPVDAEAIDRGTNPGTESKWAPRAIPGVVGGASLPASGSGMTARVAVVSSMGALAELTGGEAILVPGQVSDRLTTVAAERTTAYVVSFKDPFPADNRFHKVEVAVDRPGVKVAHRRGYRIRGEEERTLDAIVAHLEEPGGANPLAARASFDLVRKETNRNIVQLNLQYAPAEAPGSPGSEREVEVWAVCMDDEGNRASPIHRKGKAQRVAGSSGTGTFADALQLGLPPGPYTWSIALKDVPTNVTSYVQVKKTL